MKELIQAVKEMREEQKAFFKTKRKEHLYRSKELERKVDQMIEELDFKQLELFENEKH